MTNPLASRRASVPRSSWQGWAAVGLGFALVGLGVYWHALRRPLGSDARFLTYHNAFMQSPRGLLRAWRSDYFEGAITHGVPYRSGYYRPVTNTELWLEVQVAGEHDAVYNVTQVLWHVLTAVLVTAVVIRLSADVRVGLVGGMLFLVHPVHAFAATEPAARADVLFAVFYLMGLLSFWHALDAQQPSRRRWLIGATVGLLLLTVLSKEMGITLPAALCVLVAFRHFRQGSSWGLLRWTIPVWMAAAAYLAWRFLVLELPVPVIGYGAAYPSWVLALGAVKGVVIHLARLVAPSGAAYPELQPQLLNFVGRPLTDPLTYAGLAAFGGMIALALMWRRHPWIAAWSGFFLVTYAPLFRVDNIAGSLGLNVLLTQERWIYLPSVAFVALVAGGAVTLWRRINRRAVRAAAGGAGIALLVLLAWGARAHAGRYDDPFAVLKRLYLVPQERLSRLQQANKLILYAQWVALPLGDTVEAERRSRRAVEVSPDSPIPATALAIVLAGEEKWLDIVRTLEPWRAPSIARLRALQATNYRVADDLNRVNPRIVFLLADAHAHLGHEPEALSLLCAAVQRGAQDDEVDRVLQVIWANAGRPVPAGPAWHPPFDEASCERWELPVTP